MFGGSDLLASRYIKHTWTLITSCLSSLTYTQGNQQPQEYISTVDYSLTGHIFYLLTTKSTSQTLSNRPYFLPVRPPNLRVKHCLTGHIFYLSDHQIYESNTVRKAIYYLLAEKIYIITCQTHHNTLCFDISLT